eukprot:CAMPEP_0185797536 /NCGR_PEP_ID=MMETSP1174-20130828/161669_1 /TAXON_ID=35687 /ORGANISM="Dictyocha speculum, Strain CCMP1381" /LENGTH=525 /DNA_ID=CAMNT_0028492975 /DNA_START=21 /DNA_END=1598 /DNA_ORIENTATION=-
MATPALAGIAALVREFFTSTTLHQQNSPVGYATSDYDASAPSAALLRAMLVNSATNVTYGYVDCGNVDFWAVCEEYGYGTVAGVYVDEFPVRLDVLYGSTVYNPHGIATGGGNTATSARPGPDMHQGFGRTTGDRVLPVNDVTDLELFVFDSISLDAYEEWTAADLVVIGSGDLDITLSWTDYPAATYCSQCLIHDLDLNVIVTTPAGRVFQAYPNWGAAEEGTSPYAQQADTKNNIEKVALTTGTSALPLGSTVQISVAADGLAASDSQKFSLVATGKLGINTASPTPAPSLSPTEDPWVENLQVSCAVIVGGVTASQFESPTAISHFKSSIASGTSSYGPSNIRKVRARDLHEDDDEADEEADRRRAARRYLLLTSSSDVGIDDDDGSDTTPSTSTEVNFTISKELFVDETNVTAVAAEFKTVVGELTLLITSGTFEAELRKQAGSLFANASVNASTAYVAPVEYTLVTVRRPTEAPTAMPTGPTSAPTLLPTATNSAYKTSDTRMLMTTLVLGFIVTASSWL